MCTRSPAQADAAIWLGFTQGPSSGSPISVGGVCMNVCVCAYVCVCVLGRIKPVLVDSGASNYCPSVTSNCSFGLLMHTACLCSCVCGCESLTSSCVVLTWRAKSFRLWFGRLGTIFITRRDIPTAAVSVGITELVCKLNIFFVTNVVSGQYLKSNIDFEEHFASFELWILNYDCVLPEESATTGTNPNYTSIYLYLLPS